MLFSPSFCSNFASVSILLLCQFCSEFDAFEAKKILKARRTWSMTSFGMKTQREGTQLMKMIELPLAIINTTRISLHKDKVFSRA
ncbi:hypothetical protein HanIR_Chr16g0805561 [Helianthus annuus]|nr:hypothetical protein HanIR_Chr16g0805561 [Helianthus annuus]